MKVTHPGPGSLMAEVTADPAGTDVAFYRVYVKKKSCNIPPGTRPLRCELTGLEEGNNQFLVAEGCYSDNVCGYGTYVYIDTLPKGTFYLPNLCNFP